MKRYVNIKTLSEYTSLPVKTLYEWAGTGCIPSIKIRRRVLFDLNDIDSFMSSLKREAGHCEKIVNKVLENVH
jgi:excisionase family DNA binding protein